MYSYDGYEKIFILSEQENQEEKDQEGFLPPDFKQNLQDTVELLSDLETEFPQNYQTDFLECLHLYLLTGNRSHRHSLQF